MKMIISARRNPSLSRAEFFHHLRHVHWPLVARHVAVKGALAGYVQNHALGPDAPLSDGPISVARDRDSVIELYFNSDADLATLATLPEYQAEVRPDEAYFNDLPHNIMVKTDPETVFRAGMQGRCKRFDFLTPRDAGGAQSLIAEVRDGIHECALNPAITAQIDRIECNIARPHGDGAGFGEGHFALVLESWAATFPALMALNAILAATDAWDRTASFCVFATAFEMIPPLVQIDTSDAMHP